MRRRWRIKPRQIVLGNQIAFQELFHDETHTLVNHKLRNDQQRHNDQKLDMNIQILQKGYGGTPAEQLPFQSGEDQERQPGEQ